MGNQPSKETVADVKLRLEKMYKEVLDSKNISKTIEEEYCANLKIYINNDILKKYSKETLGDLGKDVILGIEYNNAYDKKEELCKRLSEYYIKKVNLVGTIINVARLAHLKIDRIKNGGMCFNTDSDRLVSTKIKPSIPLDIKFDNSIIILDEDVSNIRKEVISKSGLKKDSDLLHYLAMIEIDNKDTCLKANGKWLETRSQMEEVYLVPSKEYEKENKEWVDQAKKLETKVYEHINKLITILDNIIEERTEPQMIDGKEERVKVFRDKLLLDTDLIVQIDKAKKIIIELFKDMDSMFLVLFSIKVIGKEHLDDISKKEQELKELKGRGKKHVN